MNAPSVPMTGVDDGCVHVRMPHVATSADEQSPFARDVIAGLTRAAEAAAAEIFL